MATQPRSLAHLDVKVIARISRHMPLRDAFYLAGVNSRCLTASRVDPRIERVRNMALSPPMQGYIVKWDENITQTIRYGTVEELDIAFVARYGDAISRTREWRPVYGRRTRSSDCDEIVWANDQKYWLACGYCQARYLENELMMRCFGDHKKARPICYYSHRDVSMEEQWVFVHYRMGYTEQSKREMQEMPYKVGDKTDLFLRLLAAVVTDQVDAVTQYLELEGRTTTSEKRKHDKVIARYAILYSAVSTVLLLADASPTLAVALIDGAWAGSNQDTLAAIINHDATFFSDYRPTVELVRRWPDHTKALWVDKMFASDDQYDLRDLYDSMKVCDFTCARILAGMRERGQVMDCRGWWVDVVRSSKSVAAMDFLMENNQTPEDWEVIIHAWQWDEEPRSREKIEYEKFPWGPTVPLTQEMWDRETKDTRSRWRMFAREAARARMAGFNDRITKHCAGRYQLDL